ncbi:MAG: phosphonopyruvate decarboxylase [Alphaproteobacteria bacterium]|nr:phosphonopyruvate decarboxylase [Alphaproteobacteria bacterium]
MIRPLDFYNALVQEGLDTFYGVPDSLLKEICACIMDKTVPQKHIITANEGNALALAAGHYLATATPAVVYMQNSGEGNIINPLLSLIDEEVYRIPALLIIGWRGEPGVHDEPQHVKQGKLTLPLLDVMGIRYEVLEKTDQVKKAVQYMSMTQKPFALIVKKGLFDVYPNKPEPQSRYPLTRERAIQMVLERLNEKDIVVSTTGMISREVYENRKNHEKDFLTVGSMGHASSIALGIALEKKNRKVFCLDGDGACLMHMGAMAVIASRQPGNLKHIIFNNESHDSVGAQPTVMNNVDLQILAKAVGYPNTFSAQTEQELETVWNDFYEVSGLSLLEIKVKSGSRKDLGRPKEKPVENKEAFMVFLRG